MGKVKSMLVGIGKRFNIIKPEKIDDMNYPPTDLEAALSICTPYSEGAIIFIIEVTHATVPPSKIPVLYEDQVKFILVILALAERYRVSPATIMIRFDTYWVMSYGYYISRKVQDYLDILHHRGWHDLPMRTSWLPPKEISK